MFSLGLAWMKAMMACSAGLCSSEAMLEIKVRIRSGEPMIGRLSGDARTTAGESAITSTPSMPSISAGTLWAVCSQIKAVKITSPSVKKLTLVCQQLHV
jgi:hypothetical protein